MKQLSNLQRTICALAFTLTPTHVLAFESDHIALEVLPGWRANDGSHVAGIKLSMAPGWVTYWRQPGEAGIPPRFDLSNSQNISSASFAWPRPIVETKYGLKSFIYRDQVVIPVTLKLKDTNVTTHFQGDIEVGVCADICIPVHFSFEAILPAQTTASSAEIKDALKTVARKSPSSAVCKFTPKPDGMGIEITAKLSKLQGTEHAVVEHRDQALWVAPARLERDGSIFKAETEIADGVGIPSGLQRSDLRITLIGDNDMVEFFGCEAAK